MPNIFDVRNIFVIVDLKSFHHQLIIDEYGVTQTNGAAHAIPPCFIFRAARWKDVCHSDIPQDMIDQRQNFTALVVQVKPMCLIRFIISAEMVFNHIGGVFSDFEKEIVELDF